MNGISTARLDLLKQSRFAASGYVDDRDLAQVAVHAVRSAAGAVHHLEARIDQGQHVSRCPGCALLVVFKKSQALAAGIALSRRAAADQNSHGAQRQVAPRASKAHVSNAEECFLVQPFEKTSGYFVTIKDVLDLWL